MRILFIHPNMPGQYKHLARIFAEDPANEVVFITKPKPDVDIPNVKKISYKASREASFETHRYLVNFERGIFQGQEVWRVCKKLKEQGFTPDVICAHPGWGDGLFLKEIYPDSPLLNFQEFFYGTPGGDMNFLPDDLTGIDDMARIKIKNAVNLYSINYCDWGITPTFWQQKQYPKEFHTKMSVLHDGIDTDKVRPMEWKTFKIGNMPRIPEMKFGDEIITYISRNFEPYRGFPTFIEAADIILKKRPKARIIAIGADDVSYGKKREDGKPWRHYYIDKIKPDMSRLHFVGYLPYDEMLKVLQISSAHIYLTVPFVLSWSLLEAMSAGCAMVASRTPPVMEAIEHGKNGLLADFFSPQDVVDKIEQILDSPDRMQNMRAAARQTVVDRYDLKKLLPMHLALIRDVASKQLPPPAAKTIEEFHNHTMKIAA